MGAQRTTFDKLQRERAKKAKAAAKRERRQRRGEDDETPEEDLVPVEGEELSAPDLLARIESLHTRFEAGKVSFEDFEEQKTDLFTRLSQLPID